MTNIIFAILNMNYKDIDLTREILEKNGFEVEVDYEMGMRAVYDMGDDLHVITLIDTIFGWEYDNYIRLVNTQDLQKLFNLCRIKRDVIA